jgi:hypothetical protein
MWQWIGATHCLGPAVCMSAVVRGQVVPAGHSVDIYCLQERVFFPEASF